MNAGAQKAKELFLAAVKLDSDQWDSYLRTACAEDPELHSRVSALLQAHLAESSFLEAPTAGLVAVSDEPAGLEQPGSCIGPYKLLEQIGEGGFGLVFMAEQQHPVRRKVAVKVLKPGMDSRQVIARFEAERQALALMDHPNIARVLDGGTTESGRPYFVMELIRGIRITAYCDQNQLTPRQRLELFVTTCQAVQHAHQKGIIHRDLKPSNLLVTLHDGVPVVKIIDFGIAKALGQQLTDKTLFTGFAQMIGTPMYMSPEQAELSGLDVDTRMDIYALGALLYELLTGTAPFEEERLRQAGYDEIRRIIREEEPPKPSTRLSTLGQTATVVAAQRQSDPKQLHQLLRGELDWIVMKALEKDRNRRYETASALAADVERYLKDEAVAACPPSAGYRFRKFARRHRGALAMTAVATAALVLVVAVLAGSIGWVARDRSARDAALDGEVSRALDEAGQLIAASKWQEAWAAVQRAEKLLQAAGRQQFPPQLQELQQDLAMARRLEEIYGQPKEHTFFTGREQDGAYAQAFQDYGIDMAALPVSEAAERIRARSIRLELARALDFWSSMRRRAGVWSGSPRRAGNEAARFYTAALAVRPRTPFLVQGVGVALRAKGALREAIAEFSKAIELDPKRASMWSERGHAYGDLGQWEKAIADFSMAIDLDPKLASGWNDRGWAYGNLGQWAKAAADSSKAIELDPKFGQAWRNRGWAGIGLSRWEKALADYARALELEPADPFLWLDNAYLRLQTGDAEGYRKLCRRMLDRFGRSKKVDDIAVLAHTCVLAKDALGDATRARQLAEQRMVLTPPGSTHYTWSVHVLGLAYYRAGQWDKSVACLEQGLKNHADSESSALNWLVLAMAHHRLKHPVEARQWLDRAQQWLEGKILASGSSSGFAPAGQRWQCWLSAQMLRAEAETLMKETSPESGKTPIPR